MQGLRFIPNEQGASLVAVLLILVLMTLAGIALSQYAGIEIQISGNENHARNRLYHTESLALYATQALRRIDSAALQDGRIEWVWSEADVQATAFDGGSVSMEGLTDTNFRRLLGRWEEDPDASTGMAVLHLSGPEDPDPSNPSGYDETGLSFLGGGTGRCMAIDCGPVTTYGSQDLGGKKLYRYLVVCDYRDGRTRRSKAIEIGYLKRF